MSKSRNWSVLKTVNIVILCGLGHVLSSIILGFIGIAAGIAISGIESVEGTRGNIAAWLLLSFGILYMSWGLYRLWKKNTHHHDHEKGDKKKMTFWILFTIFIFGPCEPLIPILMYPAAQHNYGAVAYISLLFALTTIATMLLVVLLMIKGISLIKFQILEKYQHVLAGATIALCGAGIVFLGL
jgi:sulfite exporter TauE/SafE